jgi:hypothetical protein
MHWTDPGLLVVSRDHFSDNGCVSFTSQAADGKVYLLRPAVGFQVQQLCTRLLRTKRTAVVYNRVQGTLVRRPSAALHSGSNKASSPTSILLDLFISPT